MSDATKQGYRCRTCNDLHQFHPWIYAHWRERLNHKCGKCGALHEIFMGDATLLKAGRSDRKE